MHISYPPEETPPHLLPGYRPEHTLQEFLYSSRRAQLILSAQNTIPDEILAIGVPDLEKLHVAITYRIGDADFQHITSAGLFMALFWGDRLVRSSSYQVNQVNDKQILCFNGRYYNAQIYHLWQEATGIVRCTCPDYADQTILFQGHPALWEAIQHQPRCKHVLATVDKMGRRDLLNFDMPGTPVQQTV